MSLRVSVVVPTYNRAALLRRTIPALAAQTPGPFTYEVIFLGDGVTDETPALLAEAISRHPGTFRFHALARTGSPSAPRNVGIRSATGDVVVSLDDDVLPEPDLVLRHAEYHLAHPGAEDAALGELYVPDELLADPMSIFHLFPYHEVRHGGLLDFFHFWTCNLSLKRDFMLRHGMFDEGFPYYEDMLCGHRLASHGMRLRFHPAARGAHLHQLKPAGVPAKGRYVGRWLHAFVQRLPERCVKERYGILSRDIGYPLLLRRLAMRAGFRALDNPLTHAALRGLGATNGRRSRWSDLHYFLLFRRNMLAGYAEAEREARAGAPPMPARPETLRIDRGES